MVGKLKRLGQDKRMHKILDQSNFIKVAKYLLVFSFGIGSSVSASNQVDQIQFKEVFKTDDIIWGFEWISEEDMILTLKGGKIIRFNTSTKKASEVKHNLQIRDYGQGGLLDIKKDSDFAKSKLLFMTYSKHDRKPDVWTTELVQGEWTGEEIENIKPIATANAWSKNSIHFGSRIAVTNDSIFFTVGDRNERDLAQDRKVDNGKVIQVNRKTMERSVYSIGHRNPQGLTLHPETQDLWLSEHGPRGGDEINFVIKDKNYGWPVVTFGKEYWGPKISDETSKKGFEDPIHQMTPSIAPSSIMIYSGKKYQNLKHHVFLGALALQHLAVLKIENKKVISESKWVESLKERIRNVKESPKGDIVFSTDSGKLFWSQ